ncbi:hypothetical protein [Bradyrhizobium mercantei]|nr:hypothetical protein [Bradyrhizobium mercantei]
MMQNYSAFQAIVMLNDGECGRFTKAARRYASLQSKGTRIAEGHPTFD